MSRVRATFLGLLLAILSACGASAPSAEHVLIYASPYPPGHPFSQADQTWIEYIERASGGAIAIKPYWSGSLISSDMNLFELRHGVADIAQVTPMYQKGGTHLNTTQIAFYSGISDMPGQLMLYKCLMARFPQFGRELEGVRLLAVQGGNVPGILTRNRPVRSLADLKGLRLRAQGDSMDVLKDLGADPVNMPMGEVYSAMAKGVIDGLVVAPDSLRALRLAEVSRYFTDLQFSRGAYPARVISEGAWDRLPPHLQQLLASSQPLWEKAISDKIAESGVVGTQYGRDEGIKFYAIPAAQQQRFDELYAENALHRARELKDVGIDGEPVLREARRLVEERRRAGRMTCTGADDEAPAV